jgi:hypothetical protein
MIRRLSIDDPKAQKQEDGILQRNWKTNLGAFKYNVLSLEADLERSNNNRKYLTKPFGHILDMCSNFNTRKVEDFRILIPVIEM